MEASERARIMNQGVRPLDAGPLEREEARKLAEGLEGSPLRGRPLRRRLRNFSTPVDGYLVSLGGPTAWMRRLRAIEDEEQAQLARLGTAWQELALRCESEGTFARRWRETVACWSFTALNALVDDHNRYFPAEASLAMDPRTRDFVKVGGKPYSRPPYDADWILERFPPSLRAARESRPAEPQAA